MCVNPVNPKPNVKTVRFYKPK